MLSACPLLQPSIMTNTPQGVKRCCGKFGVEDDPTGANCLLGEVGLDALYQLL